MVIKVFIAGVSSSKEVKKHQQRALFTLDSLRIEYDVVDITEPERDEDKEMLREVCKRRKDAPPVTPQFFNGDDYCGDWDDFYLASDEDKVLQFLKLAEDVPEPVLQQNSGIPQGEVNEGAAAADVATSLPEPVEVDDDKEANNDGAGAANESSTDMGDKGNDEEPKEVLVNQDSVEELPISGNKADDDEDVEEEEREE